MTYIPNPDTHVDNIVGLQSILDAKASTTTVNSALAGKVDTSMMTTALAAKADTSMVNAGLNERTVKVGTLTELKATPVVQNKIVFMVGKDTLTDNQGGFFRWESTSTATEDNTFLNVVTSSISGVTTGRWLKIFTRARQFPGGTLVYLGGGMKQYFGSATTDSNGEVILPITEENTVGGTAIFNQVFASFADPVTVATGPATAVQSYKKAVTAKTITWGFYRANALTVTLGLLFTPVASIGAGTVVNFVIFGT